jgi:hypothetical protein
MAGYGGAFAVFVFGAFREWWREEREREGLLRLLLAEVEHNREVVRTIGETTWDLLSPPAFPSLTAETWRGLQGRAAALLPGGLFASLSRYYSLLQTLLTLLDFEKRGNERMNREIRRKAEELLGRKYAGSRNPWDDYLKATLDAQNEVREQVTGYLSLPWDARLLLRVVRWLERLGRRVRGGREEQPGR